MKITPELVKHVADLSQLELTPAEAGRTAEELGRILNCMDVLNRLGAVDGEAGPVPPLKNVLREDVPVPSLDRAALLAGAPASDGEMFLVPRAVGAAE